MFFFKKNYDYFLTLPNLLVLVNTTLLEETLNLFKKPKNVLWQLTKNTNLKN